MGTHVRIKDFKIKKIKKILKKVVKVGQLFTTEMKTLYKKKKIHLSLEQLRS